MMANLKRIKESSSSSHLEDFNDLQLGVHHHHVLVVRNELSFPVTQGGGRVRQTMRHTSTHHHLSHHFPDAVDCTQNIVS